MEPDKIKRDMESLWMETFKDSQAYVTLVFDSYFNQELSVWHENDGEIDSAILGVSYDFYGEEESKKLKGLYLCGIATRKDVRRQGIMSRLIEEINNKALKAGYDFTFLIPSDDGIREYYKNRGYLDCFYQMKEHFIKGYNYGGKNDLTIQKYEESIQENVISFLTKESDEIDKNKHSYRIHHTVKDWEIVLREALISKEDIYLAKRDKEIKGVIFTGKSEDSDSATLYVKKLSVSHKEDAADVLKGLSQHFPDKNITLCQSIEEDFNIASSQGVWEPFFAKNNGREDEYEDISVVEEVFEKTLNSYPAGMIRILDIDSFLNKVVPEYKKEFEGYTEKEKLRVLLRKPKGKEDDLEKTLGVPKLNFIFGLMLE